MVGSISKKLRGLKIKNRAWIAILYTTSECGFILVKHRGLSAKQPMLTVF